MNNHIKHLPNGDFEVLPLETEKCEDRLVEHDNPERIEFEKKRNYSYGTTEWDNWKPID